ncbi:MAG: hypothetical protein K0R98_679 [Rickettsiaceae bacterium]|jgi:hypothetical protein|nr:hypothetical protein [Rickettsiaceae bacterium]
MHLVHTVNKPAKHTVATVERAEVVGEVQLNLAKQQDKSWLERIANQNIVRGNNSPSRD